MKIKSVFLRAAGCALAGVMALGALTGCSGASSSTGLFIDGKYQNVDWVMKVDGQEVSMDLYRYYFLNLKTSYESNYSTSSSEVEWTDDLNDTLRTYAEGYVQTYAEAMHQISEKGLTLTDEEKQEVEDYIAGQKALYDTDEDWQTTLDTAYLTEDLLRELQQFSYLQTKLVDAQFPLSDEELAEASETVKSTYYKAEHILLFYPDDYDTSELSSSEENPITDADTSNSVYQQMVDIQSQLGNGADFETLMNQYSEDTGLTSYPDGYVFTDGDMVTQFEDTVKALGIDEVSGIFKTSYGYHIVKRLELTEDDIADEAQTVAGEAAGQSDSYETWISEQVEAASIEYCDLYNQISTDTLR